ncbi:MAG: hypothetical protein ACRC6O_13410 [Flavobacterium sp.]
MKNNNQILANILVQITEGYLDIRLKALTKTLEESNQDLEAKTRLFSELELVKSRLEDLKKNPEISKCLILVEYVGGLTFLITSKF